MLKCLVMFFLQPFNLLNQKIYKNKLCQIHDFEDEA